MRRALRWLLRPFTGTRDARRQMEASRADQEVVRELADEVRELHRENHIAARVHLAARGGRS